MGVGPTWHYNIIVTGNGLRLEPKLVGGEEEKGNRNEVESLRIEDIDGPTGFV